ncbi:transposase [Enterococcus mundtii]|uniref:Transposase n=1 Tax=Enterococcus mundtii TaxID=53346 RepID=A0A2S7RQD4_ENTMU|nr:transposase [Enterococcus mundtii]PQF21804.1 transposase [Enterococcus mundtii]
MDYHTKKFLGLTDENIIFPINWLSEKKEGDITSQVIHGGLDYTPVCCTKCGIKSKGQVIKYVLSKPPFDYCRFIQTKLP